MDENSDETNSFLLKENGSSTNSKAIENSELFGESDSMNSFRKRSYNQWSPMEEGVTLAWNDLSVYGTKTSKTIRIINGVTGAVKAGSLVALMGASGAGKSTLMTTLAHRNPGGVSVEGDILINGRCIGNYMKFLSGFMHQDDIFVGSLTVSEHMSIMAHLKLDRRITKQQRNCKINELLKTLGLAKCLNTRIGHAGDSKVLSGGEKKRLAFATELLTDPPILFCDEPTTGLDSYSAQKLVTIMNTMAAAGKTILCTIHQPSSEIFAMFSQLLLVAEGRIAFMGNTASAIEFFEKAGYKCPRSYNPGDFFIKTLAITPGYEECSKQTIKRICDHFAVSDYNKEVDVVVQYEFHMGRAVEDKTYKLRTDFKDPFCWNKLTWLVYRWFLEILRNPTVQTARILQKIMVAVMVGLCYFGTDSATQSGVQSIQGAIFLIVTENTFNPMYSILNEFPQYYPLFQREYKSGIYSTPLYYISRILSMLPGLVLEPFVFVLIVYWMSGLRATNYAFFMTSLIAVLTMNVSAACGVFFSNAFESAPIAMTYLVPFDFILMVTSGLFLKLSTIPAVFSWTKYMSWIMYSTESLTIVQWTGIKNISCSIMEAPNNDTIPCIREGSEVIDRYSFSELNLSRDLWNMWFLCISFYCLGLLCLWIKIRKR